MFSKIFLAIKYGNKLLGITVYATKNCPKICKCPKFSSQISINFNKSLLKFIYNKSCYAKRGWWGAAKTFTFRKILELCQPFFLRLVAPLAIANTLNCHGKGHQVILAEVFQQRCLNTNGF